MKIGILGKVVQSLHEDIHLSSIKGGLARFIADSFLLSTVTGLTDIAVSERRGGQG